MTVDSNRAAADQAAEARYWRWAAFGALIITLARLLWLARGQTDLYPDEAQYWLWSLTPAWGYFSKPPMVAWLIWLTTHALGTDDEFAVRLAAPLLHLGTALILFALGRRLYDARIACWSALTYAALPGVFVSAAILSTDAPLLLCWAVALYAFVRAREPGGGRWWLLVGAAAGLGLLAKYAMAYWLIAALLFLLLYRDERRHIPRFLGAAVLALALYSPNFFWNWQHGFVSYHHTEANASLHGSLFHPRHLAEFFGSQFGVFGPLLFLALLAIVALGRTVFRDRRAAMLAIFALPALAMMLVVSLLSRAQPNWAAPTYVSATLLVVAWLVERGSVRIVALSLALHLALALAVIEARPVALSLDYDIVDPLQRLRGWKRLGEAVSRDLAATPGALLLSDDREDMASLLYYVRPHPEDALKWNGDDGLVHDQFDLKTDPREFLGRDFLLVSHRGDIERIVKRFDDTGAIGHLVILLGGGKSRSYSLRLLKGFKGYGLGP
jgi:4-amino-4-deoxy-L-arabinose transferase-like glycosyltransferase